jgi:hypothetical protein
VIRLASRRRYASGPGFAPPAAAPLLGRRRDPERVGAGDEVARRRSEHLNSAKSPCASIVCVLPGARLIAFLAVRRGRSQHADHHAWPSCPVVTRHSTVKPSRDSDADRGLAVGVNGGVSNQPESPRSRAIRLLRRWTSTFFCAAPRKCRAYRPTRSIRAGSAGPPRADRQHARSARAPHWRMCSRRHSCRGE